MIQNSTFDFDREIKEKLRALSKAIVWATRAQDMETAARLIREHDALVTKPKLKSYDPEEALRESQV